MNRRLFVPLIPSGFVSFDAVVAVEDRKYPYDKTTRLTLACGSVLITQETSTEFMERVRLCWEDL